MKESSIDVIELPIHVPTALGTVGLFVSVWLVSVALKRQRKNQVIGREPKTKRRYTKKRPVRQEPITQ